MKDFMKDLLMFKRMVTPTIIQLVFWILVAMTIVSAITAFWHKEIIVGFVTLIVGPLIVRIGCETLIVLFRIHDYLADIRNKAMQEQVKPQV